MPLLRLRPTHTALLVVDLQEKLLPHIHDHVAVSDRAQRLIQGAAALGLPIVATEQYPQGLGPTVEPIRRALPADTPIHDKMRFSAWVEPVRRRLAELRAQTVVLCGIETHVCILQTAMDLLEAGCITAVAADAVGSRRRIDHESAIQRLSSCGAVISSTESALLELVGHAGGDDFKRILPIIR